MAGAVNHLLSRYEGFSSSDIMVRSREPGEQSRVINLSEKRGKVLMLTFWKPCPGCNRHLRQLQELQQEMGKDRLEVIAVNSSYNLPFEVIANALKREGFDDITPIQARDRQLSLAMAKRVIDRHTLDLTITWIIDPEGGARYLSTWTMDWAHIPEVRALLEALADGKI